MIPHAEKHELHMHARSRPFSLSVAQREVACSNDLLGKVHFEDHTLSKALSNTTHGKGAGQASSLTIVGRLRFAELSLLPARSTGRAPACPKRWSKNSIASAGKAERDSVGQLTLAPPPAPWCCTRQHLRGV